MPHRYNLRSNPPEQFDGKKYTKLLSELFPSKYSKKRAAELSSDSDSDSDYSESSESEEETDSDESIHVNITFSINGKDEDEEYEDEEDEDEEEEEDEETASSCSTEELDFYEDVKDHTKNDEFMKKIQALGLELSEEYKDVPLFKEFVKKHAKLSEKHEKAKRLSDKQERELNHKQFDKLMDNKPPNETRYFKKLSLDEQRQMLGKLTALRDIDHQEKPTRVKLIESDIPDEYKVIALQKMNQLNSRKS
jgi:hypothetical protein